MRARQVDATRVETATLAAKIRKLAMYAQQLAETGMMAGQVDALKDGHMAAKIRKLAMYAQQLAETGIKAEDRCTLCRCGRYQYGHETQAANNY